jgi:hypothetical protein
MMAPFGRLARRREALVALSTAQRETVEAALAPAVRGLAAADRALGALRAHPFIAGAIAAALGFFGPRRVLFWAARALPFYSLLRRGR